MPSFNKPLWLLAFVCLAIPGPCFAEDGSDARSSPIESTNKICSYGWAQRRQGRGYRRFKQYTKSLRRARRKHEEIPLVFYGDSITECLGGEIDAEDANDQDCKPVEEEVYEPFFEDTYENCRVFGISGDTTANLMWDLLEGMSPKGLGTNVIYLNIGTNDLKGIGLMSGDEALYVISRTLWRVKCMVEWLLGSSDAKPWVMLPALFYQQGINNPVGWEYPSPYTAAYDMYNWKLGQWAKTQPKVRFVDCNDNLLNDQETWLDATKFIDNVHPNANGWASMAGCFSPHIAELMDTPNNATSVSSDNVYTLTPYAWNIFFPDASITVPAPPTTPAATPSATFDTTPAGAPATAPAATPSAAAAPSTAPAMSSAAVNTPVPSAIPVNTTTAPPKVLVLNTASSGPPPVDTKDVNAALQSFSG